jgi:hypothetical protein
MFKSIILILLVLTASSCQSVQEPFKVVWGSSTRALEDARIDSVSKIYKCEFNPCFNAVLSLERKNIDKTQVPQTQSEVSDPYAKLEPENPIPFETKNDDRDGFEVFMKDRIKSFIVVVGVPGSTDTTEVGIFFSRYNREAFKVEISSLSTSAKQKVADMVFKRLSQDFEEIK